MPWKEMTGETWLHNNWPEVVLVVMVLDITCAMRTNKTAMNLIMRVG